MIKVKASEVDEAIREFDFFMEKRSGSFTTKLFEAMLLAHPINFYRLAEAFPNEGYATAFRFKPHELVKFQIVEDELEKI